MRKVVNTLKKFEYKIEGLDCAHCALEVEEALNEMEGIVDAKVNFAASKISYKTEKVKIEDIIELVKKVEPEATIIVDSKIQETPKKLVSSSVIRFIIGVLFAIIGFSGIIKNEFISEAFIVLSYITLLLRTTINAVKLLKSKTINENFLITISCIGAYLIGEKFEGLMVIILYEIGKILEEKAINKSRKSIADLMDIKPEYANLKLENETKKVDPSEVKIGDIVIIKEGEKIPLDGIVISGKAYLDTSSLTGESKLQKVEKDVEVLSGSINKDGLLEIKVTKEYENSTVNQILELVENATDKKAKTETFVNKITKIYTPIVIGLAVMVAFLLPFITGIEFSQSIYRALTFLVISCPCAIAISVPLSYFSGIGKSSKNGILIKGSNFLDNLKNINQIAFDKTGTLTKGEFGISKVVVLDSDYTEDDVLKYVVYGESFSNHPIAKSIIKNSNVSIDTSKVSDYNEISGKGISYKIDDKTVLVGNSKLVGVEIKNESSATVVYAKVDDKIIGQVELEDMIKPGIKEAILKLKQSGIKTKMLTGDVSIVALRIAKEVEIEEVISEMLPQDKYNEIEKMIKENNGTDKKVAFVGDGINDSPVLALADVRNFYGWNRYR